MTTALIIAGIWIAAAVAAAWLHHLAATAHKKGPRR